MLTLSVIKLSNVITLISTVNPIYIKLLSTICFYIIFTGLIYAVVLQLKKKIKNSSLPKSQLTCCSLESDFFNFKSQDDLKEIKSFFKDENFFNSNDKSEKVAALKTDQEAVIHNTCCCTQPCNSQMDRRQNTCDETPCNENPCCSQPRCNKTALINSRRYGDPSINSRSNFYYLNNQTPRYDKTGALIIETDPNTRNQSKCNESTRVDNNCNNTNKRCNNSCNRNNNYNPRYQNFSNNNINSINNGSNINSGNTNNRLNTNNSFNTNNRFNMNTGFNTNNNFNDNSFNINNSLNPNNNLNPNVGLDPNIRFNPNIDLDPNIGFNPNIGSNTNNRINTNNGLNTNNRFNTNNGFNTNNRFNTNNGFNINNRFNSDPRFRNTRTNNSDLSNTRNIANSPSQSTLDAISPVGNINNVNRNISPRIRSSISNINLRPLKDTIMRPIQDAISENNRLKQPKLTVEDLNKDLKSYGFTYDPEKDLFYSNMDCWQREFGYCRFYDEGCAPLSMIVDSEPIYFDYDGRSWLIELWKGQYGMNTGCEIGVYNSSNPNIDTNDPDGAFYNCVNDDELLDIEFTLFKNRQILLTRREKHWWLTAFKLGEFSHPSELILDCNITLKDEEMLKAFLGGLKEAGYAKTEYNVSGLTVHIVFKTPKSQQPRTRTPVIEFVMQLNNKLNCGTYQTFTKDYDNTLDKIDYIRQKAPWLYRKLMDLGKSTVIITGYQSISKKRNEQNLNQSS